MKLLLLLAAVAVGVYFLVKQFKKVKADSLKLPAEKAPELPVIEEVKVEITQDAVAPEILKSDVIVEVVAAKKASRSTKKEVAKKPAAKKAKAEVPPTKAKKAKK